MKLGNKKLVIYDLDGTLAISKSTLDDEMAQILADLSKRAKVAIISGGRYQQFEKQIIAHLNPQTDLDNLFFYPTSGAAFYRYIDGAWTPVYAERLESQQIQRIFDAFPAALEKAGIAVEASELHGEQLEDRDTQVSWSALGQQCPIDLKEEWDPDQKKRLKIVPYLVEALPEFDVRVGGTTTIDVTRKGIDKKYGIKKMNEYLDIEFDDMLFIGDAIFPGGNDYACVEMGLDHAKTSGVDETKVITKELLS